MTTKKKLLILLGSVLVVLPLMLAKVKPAPSARHVWNEYLKAEARVLTPGSGTNDAAKFANDLQAIDLVGAPKDVQKAMANYIAAVEANLEVRRAGGDVDAANERVVHAKYVFSEAMGRWRARPF